MLTNQPLAGRDKIHRLAIVAAAALAALGCGQPTASGTAVSGKVTFNGQPVTSGQIVFEPLGGGKMGVAQIADGAYRTPAASRLSPGKYLVRITANRSTGKTAPPTASSGQRTPMEVFEQYLPAKYNDASTLQIDVGQEPALAHDFDLVAA